MRQEKENQPVCECNMFYQMYSIDSLCVIVTKHSEILCVRGKNDSNQLAKTLKVVKTCSQHGI